MSALMPGKKAAVNGSKTTKTTKDAPKTKTTIVFDDSDQAEIDRIDTYLREQGIKVKADTLLIRIALRAAFNRLSKADLNALCSDLAETWKRGGR